MTNPQGPNHQSIHTPPRLPSASRRGGTPPIWILPLAIFPLLFGGVVLASVDVWVGIQSRHWTPTEGVVLSSRLRPTPPGPSQPDIRYQFTWEGDTRVSARVWPGALPDGLLVWGEKLRKDLLSRFQAGETVTVYVNPKRPERSVLIPGAGRAWMWLGVFWLFCVINLWAAWKLRGVNKV